MTSLLNSRKNLVMMAVGLCLAVLVAGWFLVISPQHQKVLDLRAQVGTQQSSNDKLRAQVAMLQELSAKLPQQQAALAKMQSKVPDKPALADLVRTLNKAADDAGVELKGIAPATPTPMTNAAGVSGIDVTLKVSGDYVSLEQYQLALEGLSRAFLVNGMTIADSSSSSTPGSTSSAATGGGRTLTATVVGRVLLQTAPLGTAATPPRAGTAAAANG